MDSDRFRALETNAGLLQQSLDRIQTAIILVDCEGYVLFANTSASSLFQRQRYVRLTAGGIEVARADEHKELLSLIQGAVNTADHGCAFPDGIMNISRRGLERPLQVLVSPIKTGKLPVAIIFIADPDLLPQVPTEWLRQLYGLTRAESRLAQLFVSGYDVKESSEQLQVKQSTVRSQLNSIFAKTRTSRQSELVRLLLIGPTQFVGSGNNF